MKFDDAPAAPAGPAAEQLHSKRDGADVASQGVSSGPAAAAGSGGGSGSTRAAKRRRNSKTPARQQQQRTPQQHQQGDSVQERLQPVAEVPQQQHDATPQQQGQRHGRDAGTARRGSRDHSRRSGAGHKDARQGRLQGNIIRWWEDRGGGDARSREGSPFERDNRHNSADGPDRPASTDRYPSRVRHDRQRENDRLVSDSRSRMEAKHDRSSDRSSRDRGQDSRYDSSSRGRVDLEQPERHGRIRDDRVERDRSSSRGYTGRKQHQQEQQRQQDAGKQLEQQQGNWQYRSTPPGASWADEVDRAEADAAAEYSLSEGEVDPRASSKDSSSREGRKSTRPSSGQLTPAKRGSSQVGAGSCAYYVTWL
eukprot:GHUV01047284.1.p1 GENE.GHUV01047284.1~~GHUV01047284.1.p1  ORF type:complete len:366 (+),score=167.61 GHUV01047284.1:597-1694(+)